MVFDLETGDEIFSDTFKRVQGTMELDGDKLRFNHELSATEIDVTTGETTSIGLYSYDLPPRASNLTSLALAFDSDLTRLLWSVETTDKSSVAAIGDSIVISTWRQHP